MTPRARLLAIAMTVTMTAAMAAACTSPAVRGSSYGPMVTLRTGVYGSPGYQQSGLDDIQAVPLDEISRLPPAGPVASYLNTLGASALQGGWLPWAWPEATTASGQTLGLGADVGPMAICYRPSLLREAGLPTSRTTLARQWSTWPGYIQVGERFAAHTPAGTGLS